MNNKLLLLLFAMSVMTMQTHAQSVEEQADHIGIVGFWKMIEMSGRSSGEEFTQEMDGSSFYVFKKDGSAQYSTSDKKIANARWTLKEKSFHVYGNDKVNDPDGIDYTFTLVMVTPEKLVLKLGDDKEFANITFRKSNATLKPVGNTTKKRTQIRRK